MPFEKITEKLEGEISEEEAKLSQEIFETLASAVTLVMDKMEELRPEAAGGLFMVFSENGDIIGIAGNTPPSITLPALRNALQSLGADKEFLQTAYADTSGKAN